MTTKTPQTPIDAIRTLIDRLNSNPPLKSRRAVTEALRSIIADIEKNAGALDLTAVPDADLNREFTRRIGLKRDPNNWGRKKIMRECPSCGQSFGGRELRVHIPSCRQTMKAADGLVMVRSDRGESGN